MSTRYVLWIRRGQIAQALPADEVHPFSRKGLRAVPGGESAHQRPAGSYRSGIPGAVYVFSV